MAAGVRNNNCGHNYIFAPPARGSNGNHWLILALSPLETSLRGQKRRAWALRRARTYSDAQQHLISPSKPQLLS